MVANLPGTIGVSLPGPPEAASAEGSLPYDPPVLRILWSRSAARRAAFVAGLVVVILASFAMREASRGNGRDRPVATPDKGGTTGRSPATTTGPIPGPDQAFVTGTAGLVTGVAEDVPLLALPVTLTVAERGSTGADILMAIVDGKRVTIHWDGGRPLPLTGPADAILGIDVSGAPFRADDQGLTFRLDGDPHSLAPGAYSVGTTVAIGAKGLGTPRDGVTFTADAETMLQAKGPVVGTRPVGPYIVKGPGSLEMTGSLSLRTGTGTVARSTIGFGPGPFELTLIPTPAGYTVRATLQGTTR